MHNQSQKTIDLSNHFLSSVQDLIKTRDDLFVCLNFQLSKSRQIQKQYFHLKKLNCSTTQTQGKSISNQGSTDGKKQTIDVTGTEPDHAYFESDEGIRKSRKQSISDAQDNYGRAILSFILRSPLTKSVAKKIQVEESQFISLVKQLKNNIYSFESLQENLAETINDDRAKKCIRILAYHYLRRYSLKQIFNHKVNNHGLHIKHRHSMLHKIQNQYQWLK